MKVLTEVVVTVKVPEHVLFTDEEAAMFHAEVKDKLTEAMEQLQEEEITPMNYEVA